MRGRGSKRSRPATAAKAMVAVAAVMATVAVVLAVVAAYPEESCNRVDAVAAAMVKEAAAMAVGEVVGWEGI